MPHPTPPAIHERDGEYNMPSENTIQLIINNNLRCPKCGWESNNGGLDVSIKDFEGSYCLKCYAEWIAATFPKIEKI